MTTGDVRFGLNITSDEGRGVDPRVRVARQLEQATCARDCGFDLVSTGTRYSYGPAAGDERGPSLTTWRLQPMLLMAYLASQLGTDIEYAITVILASAVNPVQLAEDIASLDALTGGGLSVGMGLGWHPYDLEAFGVSRKSRTRRFEELVTVTKRLLTEDAVTFDGEFYRMHDVSLVARSVQQPRPPIWLGASVEASVRRAARHGDAWTISSHHDVQELRGMVAVYRDELDRVGRPVPPRRPINRHVCIAESRDEAIAEARQLSGALYRKRMAYGAPEERVMEGSTRGETPYIVGNPTDCAAQIVELQDALDVNVVFLGLSQGMSQETRLRTIELLGREVLPQVR